MHGSARCLPPIAAVALFALVFGPGCSRHFFRERADKDVEGVITQKNVFPGWQVRSWHVYPDSRARYADQFNPDRPAYPPDDYAARVLSPNPQKPTKKTGVGRVDGTGYLAMLEGWDAQNRAEDPPPPARGAAAWNDPTPRPPPPGGEGEKNHSRAVSAPTSPKPHFAPLPAPPLPPGEGAGGWGSSPIERRVHPPLPAALRLGAPVGPSDLPEPTEVVPSRPAPVAANGTDFGPWSAAGGSRGKGPAGTELRPPVVMVAVGETELNGKTVPAIAVVPVGGAPLAQPEKQPDPKVMPGPMPPDPKRPEPKSGEPVGQGTTSGVREGLLALAAGDAADAYLRALESAQVGYRLKLEQAVELGVLNGREFQDRREDLYLSALDVTLNRFTFAAQAFFTEQAIRESTGDALNRNFRGTESTEFNTSLGFSKRFPTGALLLLRVANQVVVDLSGDSPTTSVSNLALSLSQPFLRGGGKAVTLEPLTQSERTLVYAMRSYARFRKIFFVAIAAGGGYTNNPYGLQGLSPNLGRGIGGNLTAPNVGYLPLLLQLAVINNQRKNVQELERLLDLYRKYGEGGQVAPLQVDQVEVQLLNSRGQLLGSAGGGGGGGGIRGFLDALDNFKLQLGLPVTVPLELNDAPLRPIRLQLGRLEEVFALAAALDREVERFDPAMPAAQFRARWRALLTDSPMVRGTEFARTIGARWDAWAKLTADELRARRNALAEERRKLEAAQTDRQAKRIPDPEADVRRLAAIRADLTLADFELAVRVYEGQPWLKKGEAFVSQATAYRAMAVAVQALTLQAREERLGRVRQQWPELAPLPVEQTDVLAASLDEAYAAGVQTALSNRLDLMNARAQVVDAWRQIAVTANSLQGVFDVRYDLASSTPAGGNNPVGFSGDRSAHTLTFNAELPLVRRAQRNNYRAALISYQRQRRTLMAFEDNIANDVRADLRELRTLAQLYRIQQRVVELGYSVVESAELTAFAPQPAGTESRPGDQAALTQQVLQARSNLVQSQNQLFQIWVAYLTARMNLYLDLEQMPLDDRGVWCDEFFNRADRQDRTPPDDRPAGERLPAPRPVDHDPGR